jgi:hypothetical protein
MQPDSAFSISLNTVKVHALAAAVALALAAAPAIGEGAEVEAEPAPPPGLPAGLDGRFNFDATVGAFGFADPLYPIQSQTNRPAISATTVRRVDQAGA